MLGRTAVGAVIGGSTGAIIGGTTASKTTIIENPTENVEPRFSILINTNTISKPIIEIDFEEHKETLQQLIAILEIILRNKQKDDGQSNEKIEELDYYLQEEIRKQYPDIASKEIEKEKERQARVDHSGGCMGILMIPILLGVATYFLL